MTVDYGWQDAGGRGDGGERGRSRPQGDLLPGGRLDRLVVRGRKLRENVAMLVRSASITLEAGSITTFEASIHDPDLALLKSQVIDQGGPIDYGRLKMVVAVVSTSEADGGLPALEVVARSLGVRKLRRRRGEEVWNKTSPTQVAAAEARACGLKFVGQPSARRRQITRGKRQSTWKLLEQLASELGYVCFEAGGTLFFGKPTWLLARDGADHRHVTWHPDQIAGDPHLAGFPVCRRSEDSKKDAAEVTVRLHDEADDWLPGDVLVLHGVPTFSGKYLITSVRIPLVSGEPVEVVASTPVNPTAQPPAKRTPEGKGGETTGDAPEPSGVVERFVSIALGQAGTSYVFGAEASAADPDPDAFDCSELVEWALRRVGVTFPDGSANQLAYCRSKGTAISVEQAIRTRGALLFHPGHVAISLGNGRTIEAANRTYGTVSLGAAGRFTSGALIPGLRYGGR